MGGRLEAGRKQASHISLGDEIVWNTICVECVESHRSLTCECSEKEEGAVGQDGERGHQGGGLQCRTSGLQELVKGKTRVKAGRGGVGWGQVKSC